MNSTSSYDVEPDGGTPLSTMAWGLKHFWWLVALGVLGGALVVPWYKYQQPSQFDATSLVVASKLQISTTVLPRYATSVFDNGKVADAVVEDFGARGDLEDVVPREVSMVAAQDSIVMQVIGHSSDPDEAVSIADVAAATFVEELNSPGDGVGTFEVQSRASAPVEATEPFKAAPYSLVVGTIGGFILGVGIVLLILVVRRPVVARSRQLAGLPVAGLLLLPRRRLGRRRGTNRLVGATTVARNVLKRSPDVIYVLGPVRQASSTQMVTWALRDAIGRAPTKGALIRRIDGSGPLAMPIIQIDSPDDSRLLEMSADTVILVVAHEGMSHTDLCSLTDPFEESQATVVVVRRTFRAGPETNDVVDLPDVDSKGTSISRTETTVAGLSRANPAE